MDMEGIFLADRETFTSVHGYEPPLVAWLSVFLEPTFLTRS